MEHPIDIVYRRAQERSATFIEANLSAALLFRRKPRLHRHVAERLAQGGLMIECGVYQGASINRMAQWLPTRTIYGFDSFEGLSEDWLGHNHGKGHFDLGGKLPKVEENVRLIKGWVDDTFAPFLDQHDGVIDYLHVDTDTYSPAKTILSQAKHRLVPGSIVLFDELYGFPGWEQGEYQALKEEFPDGSYDFIGFSQMEAALRITGPLV